ncbi:MAG TPA: hypothetical protein VK771_05090 [Acidimicrobiia bacterium]|jgi:hypothetical protein|nr:hypothetical protein [Acidimicrobiia bacterium]
MTKPYRRSRRVAVAATAIGLAACGGAGSSPHVASLGTSRASGASTTTTVPKGNPTELLDEWAACMRTHGDPGQVDPTVDANGVIHITLGHAGNGPVTFGGPGGKANSPCGAYLTAASSAVRGGKPLPKPDPAKLEKFARCMRAHGVGDFPDPSGGGLSIRVHPGGDLNPNSPTFQNASKLCAASTGVPGIGGTPQRGAIEATSGDGPAGGPGGNGGVRGLSVVSGGGGG